MENEIKSARKAAHLTQNQLSEMLGIPYRTLQNWENGTPTEYNKNMVLEKIREYRGETKTLKKYYYYSPRGFSNEYEVIYVCNSVEEEKLKEWFRECDNENNRFFRITTKELADLRHEERERRKNNENFSGYCNPFEPISLDEFLNF